jgi:2'-hydroxyisoflavone reductase
MQQKDTQIHLEKTCMASRRDFLATISAATVASGVTMPSAFPLIVPIQKAAKPLRILILGGTGFIGPHQVRYALARGHKLTLFNRGKTNPKLFAGEVEQLEGDRATGNLESLKGKEWDVIIDNPTTLPRWAREAAQLLKNSAKQYLFISTISVYADNSKPGMDETAETAKTDKPDDEKITGLNYGALKALSEKEVEKAFPGRATIIRPGLIVGPGDTTDRFTYWPARINRGGEVLAPGDGADPVQIIDGRDLGEFCIRMVEQGDTGVYNATGPASELTMAEMLYGIRAVTTANVKFTWVDMEFIRKHQIRAWSEMPVWVPGTGETAGFSRTGIARALAKGLTFRPLADTAAATIEEYRKRTGDAAKLKAGLSPEREAELLKLWHESRKQDKAAAK